MSKALADILLKDKVITQQQYDDAINANKASGEGPLHYLIRQKFLAETKLLQYLGQKYSMPAINLARYNINPEVIKLLPSELAHKYHVIPIQQNKGVLVCAISDPTMLIHLDDIKFKTRLNIEAVLTTPSAIEQALGRYYTGSSQMAEAVGMFQKNVERSTSTVEINPGTIQIDAGAATDKDAPVISLVNQILVEAIRKSASDIHIESYEHRSRVRMRLDGVLQEVISIPVEMRRSLIARIKIMSKLDISESRLPQDGRIKVKVGNGEVDFRVSTMPCLFGEKAVLRLLSRGSMNLDLSKLGFEAKSFEVFKKAIALPNGMILVTGPTGSGKTTTLYAAISELNKITDNISTVEDPVEYNLDGINQVQVNKEIGLTFANVLRTFLRQDPDIILVGEIRDLETAEVAIQAALTGHLVFSTLHTNDAPSTLIRLMNMGIEPFLVTSAVNCIVAQRLLRTICSSCREPANVPVQRLTDLGIPEQTASQIKLFKGRGCQSCGNTGFKGRIAIYEILDFSTSLKEMVLNGATAIDLKKAAIRDGMRTLRIAGLQKAVEGRTSLEEVLAMTSPD
ncbi:MAG: type IV-A pilus assembly ATPase PilB [Bacteriovoracia bacterium]